MHRFICMLFICFMQVHVCVCLSFLHKKEASHNCCNAALQIEWENRNKDDVGNDALRIVEDQERENRF